MLLRTSRPTARLLGWALCCAAACGPGGATPVPQPPLLAIPLDRLTVQPSESSARGYPSTAAPGTAPAGARVRVTNLDDMQPPVEAVAKPDGSFSFDFRANPGEELRFEWLTETERSDPSDAQFLLDGRAPTLVAAPRFACLSVVPGLRLTFSADGTGTVVFQNGCGAPLQVDNARTRLGLPDYAIRAQLPANAEAGQEVALDVAFARSAAGEREDVLLLDLRVGTQLIRYPITLTASP
jgi:hypothetical protein